MDVGGGLAGLRCVLDQFQKAVGFRPRHGLVYMLIDDQGVDKGILRIAIDVVRPYHAVGADGERRDLLPGLFLKIYQRQLDRRPGPA